MRIMPQHSSETWPEKGLLEHLLGKPASRITPSYTDYTRLAMEAHEAWITFYDSHESRHYPAMEPDNNLFGCGARLASLTILCHYGK